MPRPGPSQGTCSLLGFGLLVVYNDVVVGRSTTGTERLETHGVSTGRALVVVWLGSSVISIRAFRSVVDICRAGGRGASSSVLVCWGPWKKVEDDDDARRDAAAPRRTTCMPAGR
jgi:hypothetical protein